jgi:flagellar basal-body rod protein FlgC
MSLFAALSIGASGMAAERVRAEALTENLANAETTRTPVGGPYRRKDVVFESTPVSSPFSSVFDMQMQSVSGVQVADVVTDMSAPEMRFLPGHPDANAEGYVAFPHVNPAEDMVDLMGAARNYEANIAAMSAVKDMIQKSIDLLH